MYTLETLLDEYLMQTLDHIQTALSWKYLKHSCERPQWMSFDKDIKPTLQVNYEILIHSYRNAIKSSFYAVVAPECFILNWYKGKSKVYIISSALFILRRNYKPC